MMKVSNNLDLVTTLGVPIIEESRRYWFIRTEGGKFRDEFIEEEFIGINWNTQSNLTSLQKCNDNPKYRRVLRDGLAATLDNNVKKPGKF